MALAFDVSYKGAPQALVRVVDGLDDVCRDYIASSSFCLLASSDPGGVIDISPKGDPAGFVRVLDDKHLAIPDRAGNRRVDTFYNLLKGPRIGMLFLIPGSGETLRVGGKARIVRDEALRESMAVNRKAPQFAIVVHVERALVHCPKCVMRSKLWEPDAWGRHNVASIGQAMIAQGGLELSEDELFEEARKAGVLELY